MPFDERANYIPKQAEADDQSEGLLRIAEALMEVARQLDRLADAYGKSLPKVASEEARK